MARRTPDAPAASPDAKPEVRLGELAEGSIAPSVFAIIDRGAGLRPFFAREMRGAVLLCFNGAHPAVRIEFAGDAITVSDAREGPPVDLRLDASLADLISLISVPLAGGVPKPTSKRGRAALARLADGRVQMDGPIGLGRRLLRLMSVVSE